MLETATSKGKAEDWGVLASLAHTDILPSHNQEEHQQRDVNLPFLGLISSFGGSSPPFNFLQAHICHKQSLTSDVITSKLKISHSEKVPQFTSVRAARMLHVHKSTETERNLKLYKSHVRALVPLYYYPN